MSTFLPRTRTGADAPARSPLSPPSLSRLSPSPGLAGALPGGRALDGQTQTQMSARFGHDFSQVRIHTDSRAEDSAEAMGANAFALGSDIVFGAGKYTPGSPSTDRLLAHELTHVVQQARFGPGDPSRASGRGDASEGEADALASQVVRGQDVRVQARPGAALAREEAPGAEGVQKNALVSTMASDPLGLFMGLMQGGLDHSVHHEAEGIEKARKAEAGRQEEFGRRDFADNHPDWKPTEPAGTPAAARQEGVLNAGRDVEIAEGAAAFERTGGAMALGSAEDATRMAGPLKYAEGANKAIAPFLTISAGQDMYADLKDHHYGKAAVDGTNLVSGGIGTADLMGMLGGAKFLPGLGQVLGTFGASFGIGTELYNTTPVGQDSRDSIGQIDGWLGDHGMPMVSTMDDRRHELWQQGGAKNDLKAVGYGLGEAGVATAGAGMGLAKAGAREMRDDDEDAYSGIDRVLGAVGAPSVSTMDDRRHELWQQGGAKNDLKAVGYGLGEAGVATAGAIAGGAKTTYRAGKGAAKWAGRQAESAAGAIWDFVSDDPVADALRDMELAKGANQVSAQLAETLHDQDHEQIGPVTSVAHEEMPPAR